MEKLEPLEPENAGFRPKLNTNRPAKAVIFDIYGTLLISSSGDIHQSMFTKENMKEALKAGGFANENTPTETYSFLLDQLPVKVKENHAQTNAKGHPFPDVDIFKVWNEMLNEAENAGLIKRNGTESLADTIMVFEILSNKVAPMPGMKEVLEKLKSKGIPLGIVSNAQFYTPIIMNYFLNRNFSNNQDIDLFNSDLIAFSYSELRAKPDVALFNRLVETLKNKYKIDPQDAVFVGNDFLKDVYTANKAGLRTALFAGDNRSLRLREDDERVKNLTPDFVITELKQLLKITE